MADNKQITRTNPRRHDCVTEIRMGKLCPCGVRLFKQGSTETRRRQNGKGIAGRSCYTKNRQYDRT